MTAKAKKKDTSASGTVVYCGPTIPGVAKQFTIYNNGIPRTLAEEIVKTPATGGLVVPLDTLPAAMKQLHDGKGRIYTLYRLVQKTH